VHRSAAMLATYDYRLVTLSVLIAICASYTALDLAGRVTAARNSARLAWLFGGAISMGTGIWSMHYTGMLAYRLPMPVYYHIPTVVLSLLAAICASLIALFVISRERMDVFHIVGGSLLIAAGIVTMHYTGMAAMRLAAMHEYDPLWVTASVVIAGTGLLFGRGADVPVSRGQAGDAAEDSVFDNHGSGDSRHALYGDGRG
jgi:two-component system, sensor histidine kinase and response regulator